MYANITVNDLTMDQWDYLKDNLPERYDIPDGAIRVRVAFELDFQLSPRIAEMSVRDFMALMSRLQNVHREDNLRHLDISDRWYPR